MGAAISKEAGKGLRFRPGRACVDDSDWAGPPADSSKTFSERLLLLYGGGVSLSIHFFKNTKFKNGKNAIRKILLTASLFPFLSSVLISPKHNRIMSPAT